MKFKEYLKNLQKLAKERPEVLDYEVVYSHDDEGNWFESVYYKPSVGEYDSKNKEFQEETKPNSVCIN